MGCILYYRGIVGGVVQSLDGIEAKHCTVYTQNVSTLRSSSDVCMVASIQAVYIHIGQGLELSQIHNKDNGKGRYFHDNFL